MSVRNRVIIVCIAVSFAVAAVLSQFGGQPLPTSAATATTTASMLVLPSQTAIRREPASSSTVPNAPSVRFDEPADDAPATRAAHAEEAGDPGPTRPSFSGSAATPSMLAAERCRKATTEGKHDDEHRTGNEPIDIASDLASLAPNRTAIAFFANDRSRRWTSIERDTRDKSSPFCFYRVRNFCVDNGALTFIRPSKAHVTAKDIWPDTGVSGNSGTLRLCNELRPKVNFRFFVADSAPKGVPWVAAADGSAHVAACWQYYGYHLAECVASVFVTLATHGFVKPLAAATRSVDQWLFNHAVSLPVISRNHYSHAMYMGGTQSWNDTAPRRPKYRQAPWWPLWSQATADPSRVDELFKFPVAREEAPAARCYELGLIGSPNHNAIPGPPRRAHRAHLDSLFLPASAVDDNRRRAASGTVRVLVTQRGAKGKHQGGRRILNLDAVVAALRDLRNELPNGIRNIEVLTVDWAELPFAEQYALAATVDIVVAMHGGGNAWIFAQRPRTAFIEVWPQCIARNVYLVMARQYNVRYYSLCLNLPVAAPAGSPEARYGFLHASLTIPPPLLKAKALAAVAYIAHVRRDCGTEKAP